MKIIVESIYPKSIIPWRSFIFFPLSLMRRKIYQYIGLLILVLLLAWRAISMVHTDDSQDLQKFCIKDTCFMLELADTSDERTKGLMFRTELPENRGMIFIFSESSIHTFWMKNTLIPLDIIRLDGEYRIVDIQEVQPCREDPCQTYVPEGQSSYVIELNLGTAKKLGIQK